jgi:microcystin-dependent protein
MNIKYILYIIIFIQIFILYNKNYDNITEDFADTTQNTTTTQDTTQDITDAVKELYKQDLSDINYIFKLGEDIKIKPFTFNYNLNVTEYLNLFPKGSIVIYNDKVAPNGWVLCDGDNGTPDLRGRFVRMWNDNELSFDSKVINDNNLKGVSKNDTLCKILKHNINTIGGTDLYKITDTKLIPKHNHKLSDVPDHNHNLYIQLYGRSFLEDSSTSGKPYVQGGAGRTQVDYLSFTTEPEHTHTISSVGSSDPKYITNQPPYYVLTYIMKT